MPPQITEREVEVEHDREARALALADKLTAERILEAEAKGRREQLVDSRLDGHEARLNAINGSISRSAAAQEATNVELRRLIAKVDKSEGIAAALSKASVSRREFWLGVFAVLAVLIGAIISSGVHI